MFAMSADERLPAKDIAEIAMIPMQTKRFLQENMIYLPPFLGPSFYCLCVGYCVVISVSGMFSFHQQVGVFSLY
jgi:hypothetical protein